MTDTTDANLYALWFTPDAIRDHFADGDDDLSRAVEQATDEDLYKISDYAISADTLYEEFHRLLVAGAQEFLSPEED